MFRARNTLHASGWLVGWCTERLFSPITLHRSESGQCYSAVTDLSNPKSKMSWRHSEDHRQLLVFSIHTAFKIIGVQISSPLSRTVQGHLGKSSQCQSKTYDLYSPDKFLIVLYLMRKSCDHELKPIMVHGQRSWCQLMANGRLLIRPFLISISCLWNRKHVFCVNKLLYAMVEATGLDRSRIQRDDRVLSAWAALDGALTGFATVCFTAADQFSIVKITVWYFVQISE